MQAPFPKKELLSPAGNYESFLAAVENGADAVYLAGVSFGARAYAENFTNEQLKKVIALGHLYGVKVYVTMNTMIKEKEVESFLQQVSFLYQNGVDAILMQDIGMICLCREMFPELEIHASTQVNCSNEQTLRILEKIGVKRVVFPREMSLDTIKSIKTSLEKEIFIHGALCVSYSGNCLLSFLNGGRSANRGECAGACRLAYTLLDGRQKIRQGYLLSMKELYTAPSFEQIKESDVLSLKIEGRMKSPSYVAKVTQYYRDLLDKKNPTPQDLDELKTLFYREFTKGHLLGSDDFINEKYSNHLGLFIGNVEKITPQKIWIRLQKDLYQEDGIRFQKSRKGMIVNFLYDEDGKLVSKIEKGHLACVKNTLHLSLKDEVYKTSSKFLEKKLLKAKRKKIPIQMFFKAHVGSQVTLTIIDNEQRKVKVSGRVVESAKTSCVSKEKIESLLKRLKETPFEAAQIFYEMDPSIFISLGEINQLRRDAIQKLIDERMKIEKRPINQSISFPKNNERLRKQMTALVRDESSIKKALEKNFDRIYVADKALYQKYASLKNIYYAVLRNQFEAEKIAKTWSQELRENSYLGYALNVANSYSVYYLSKLGAKSIMLSVELSSSEQEQLLKAVLNRFGYLNIEMIVKGKPNAMVIKGNVLKLKENKVYQLKNEKNNLYNVFYKEGLTTVLSNDSMDRIHEIPKWFSLGVCSFCQIFEE